MIDPGGFEQLMAKKGVPAVTDTIRYDSYHTNDALGSALLALIERAKTAKGAR